MPPLRPRHRLLLAVLLLLLAPTAALADEPEAQGSGQELVVYLIDHQQVSQEEMAAIQGEIEAVFEEQAGLHVRWVLDDSPRRPLAPQELRVLILASDGTRWFHGPSNVIGLAPHDDRGIGRNCFVFYRQALWFRQQAVLRCREATRARTQAAATGAEIEEAVEDMAPADCGDHLPSLTPLIVARAAAHEIVHILLNKLDHSDEGLMRDSFDLREWLSGDADAFRLLPAEIAALRDRFDGAPPVAR